MSDTKDAKDSKTEKKIPEKMRAVIMEKKGETAIHTVDVPVPTSTQVLLEVIAASVNPVDWKMVIYNFLQFSKPHGVGVDVSGIVRAVGKDVKNLKVGDEVFTNITFGICGSFAEYAVCEAICCGIKSPKVFHEQAASLPVTYLSAWDGFDNAKFEAKQTIYIPGGAGGVGHMAVQLAKIKGLVVIATGGNEASLKILKQLNVDHIIDYKKSDPVAEVMKITGNKGVDLVYDGTYQESSFVQSAKVLKDNGQFIILGSIPDEKKEEAKIVAQKKASFVLADLVRYNMPSCKDEKKIELANALTGAMKLIEDGKFVPIISNLLLLDDVPAELEAMHKGRSSPGKTVVRIHMRAVMFDKPEKCYLGYKSIPIPNDDQVLLEVISACINPVDWKILYYNWTGLTLPSALGTDVAGVIRSVGKNVTDFKVGDHVVGCLSLWAVGSFAENAVVDATRLAKIGNVSFDVAASLPVTFLSAWEGFIKPEVQKLVEDKKTKPTVYIAGGGGGVGHMAIQVAKHFGFTVISSGSREDSIKVIKASGADHVIDYKKEDVIQAVHKYAEKGVDLVYDSTYQAPSFLQSAKVLKEGGIFVILGGQSVPKEDSDAGKAIAEKKAKLLVADLVPLSKADAKTTREHVGGGLASAIKLIEENKLTPHISKINFDAVPKALEDSRTSGGIGKVVVQVKGVH